MKFAAFIENLAKESRFDRNLIKHTYETYIFTQRKDVYVKFELLCNELWKHYLKDNKSIEVANFFVEHGDELFRAWLRIFFPFNIKQEQLILGFKAGGTPEDFAFHMFYRFSQEELEVITRSFEKYKIREISTRAALTRIFIEAFLSMQPTISKTVGYGYTLMLVDSKLLVKENVKGRVLHLEIAARPSE